MIRPRALRTVVVGGLLRKPSRLVGTRFRETPEYPDFAWREAILNAVAHRDYAVEGRTTEVWLFDDRMEVESPGGLIAQVSLDDLRARTRIHQSRNPRLVRVLVDLGYMRDQGEGIPRVFAEMEALFLPEPQLDADARRFHLTLGNTPSLSARDRAFVGSLGSEDLADNEFRALLEAFRHGRVDNAEMRRVAGLDTLGASKLLRGLRDRALLEAHGAGSSTYYELPGYLRAPEKHRAIADGGATRGRRIGGSCSPNGGGSMTDGGELQEHLLSKEELELIRGLGTKPRSAKLRAVIRRLLTNRWWTPRQLAATLGRDPASLVEDHLGPMAREGELERRFDEPNHPGQAYRTTAGPLFARGGRES